MNTASTSDATTFDSLLLIAESALDSKAESFRPLEQVLDDICEYVTVAIGCVGARIRILSADAKTLIPGGKSKSQWELDEVLELGDETFSRNVPGELSPSVQVFHSGLPKGFDTEVVAEGTASRQRLEDMGIAHSYGVPVILRGRPVGVLTCYWAEAHTVSAAEASTAQAMARLAAIGLATARIADSDEKLRQGLEEVHSRLQADNTELQNVQMAQSRMLALLAEQSALTVEQTARVLASSLKRSVLVLRENGEEAALEAAPFHVETLRAVAKTSSGANFGIPASAEHEDATVLRIDGAPGSRAAGMIILTPKITADQEFDRVVAHQAALVIGANIQAHSANTTMVNYALPFALISMSRGLLNASQLKEMRALLELGVETPLALVTLSTPTPEAAFRISRRPAALISAGWQVVTAAADGNNVLVLVHGELPTRESVTAALDHLQEASGIGVSSLAPGLEHLPERFREVRIAGSFAARSEGVSFYDDFGTFVDITGSMSVDKVRSFVEETIGAVQEYDDKRDAELMKTLQVFLENNGQAPESAATLSVHVNTLHKRIARIEELTGLRLRSYRDMARVLLALDLLPTLP